MNESKKKWTIFFNRILKFSLKSITFMVNHSKGVWKKMPDQIKRLMVPIVMIIAAFVVAKKLLVPSDFGLEGHYRASAVDEIMSQEVQYVGHKVCEDCHDDITGMIKDSYHRNVMCEVCHGPAAEHINEPGEKTLPAPRERGYCPLCHEYLPPRPTGFPQIVSESHNPIKACISCHDPHDPKTPEVPKECEACHAEIARTKARSHHVDLSCTICHETSEEHKIQPRQNRPNIPKDREFCGRCHDRNSTESPDILKIDMGTHGERYTCWQCHYPHLPEGK